MADPTAAYVGNMGSSYYGVDCLAVTQDGASVIVGNSDSTNVFSIDTATYAVTPMPIASGAYPVGVTITSSPYNMIFQDDAPASQLCVSSKTGVFQWTVMSGPYTGMTYNGMLNVYNGGTMFWSKPGASQYVYVYYDPNGHTAWGYIYDFTTGVYSSLYDSNTLNDPATCATSVPHPPV